MYYLTAGGVSLYLVMWIGVEVGKSKVRRRLLFGGKIFSGQSKG
jgi:hypothetical protein